MFYNNSVTQYYANSHLLSDLKNANLHLGRGQQVKEKRKIIPLSWYYLSPTCFTLPHLNTYQYIICFSFPFFSSKVTMVPIFHVIIDTTGNLSPERIGKSLSQLIYETSPAIDTCAKSNVKGDLVTFVRAMQ